MSFNSDPQLNPAAAADRVYDIQPSYKDIAPEAPPQVTISAVDVYPENFRQRPYNDFALQVAYTGDTGAMTAAAKIYASWDDEDDPDSADRVDVTLWLEWCEDGQSPAFVSSVSFVGNTSPATTVKGVWLDPKQRLARAKHIYHEVDATVVSNGDGTIELHKVSGVR